ncbi:MAG TPA: DUF937 domain-containing protein, partial [Halioglobus sp.]
IQQGLGGNISKQLGQHLGEPQGSTQSALGLLLPAVLGVIAQKGATPQGATSLMSLINGANLDVNSLDNIGGLFGGGGAGVNALTKSGPGLVSSLFGDKSGTLANALASSSGINSSSATNLLALVVPLILALLKKFIGARGLNASSLSSLLASQGPYLKDSLDSRVTGALGFPNAGAFLGNLGNQATGATRAGSAAATAAAANNPGLRRWFPWLIGAAVLLFLWNLLSNKPTETLSPPPIITAPPPAPTTMVTTALPAKVYFDVGASVISAESNNTIAEVAKTINSEGLQVAVTGYTDRTGDVGTNEELARNRVMAVIDALKAAGVAETSIEMKPPMFVESGAGEGSDAEARRVDITSE